MKLPEGVINYPYTNVKKGNKKEDGFIHPSNEPHRIVIPDARYVPEKMIIKPYTRAQKDACLLNR